MRIFWGAVLGTVLNLGLFAGFTWANGTPVPSVYSPAVLLRYPTGSISDTLLIAGVIYFISLVITCLIIPRKRNNL